VRLTKRQADLTRAKIRSTMIVNRLEAFLAGEKDPRTNRKIVLSREQLKAAELLLARAIPTLVRTEVAGELGVNHSGSIATTERAVEEVAQAPAPAAAAGSYQQLMLDGGAGATQH
jgi:hypothetical protein